MNMKMTRRILLLTAALLVLGTASRTWANHGGGLRTVGSRNCGGAHCTFVARWFRSLGSGVPRSILDATLNMETFLVGSEVRRPSETTATIPIEASGELTGVTTFISSPPITFSQNGTVTGTTTGLERCNVVAPESVTHACFPGATTTDPLLGEWSDAWAVFTDPDGDGRYDTPTTDTPTTSVTCVTEPSPGKATRGSCTAPTGFAERVRVELQRRVQNFTWSGAPVHSTSPPFPFPGTMTSSAFIDFGAHAADINLEIVPPLTRSPTSPRAGNLLTLGGTVRNAGTAAAPASETRLRIDVDADGSWDVRPDLMDTGALAPGGTTTETWTDSWAARGGTHRFEICADANNVIPEPDESDNCQVQVFTVGELTCRPQEPTVSLTTGGQATFTASGGISDVPGSYSWTASDPDATPQSGTGTTFAPTYTVASSPGAPAWKGAEKTVTVTNSGESTSCTVIVSPYPPLTCTGPAEDPVNHRVGVNQPATFRADGSNGTYAWSAPGGNPTLVSGGSHTFTTRYAAPGSYTVEVRDGTTALTGDWLARCDVTVPIPSPARFPPGSFRER